MIRNVLLVALVGMPGVLIHAEPQVADDTRESARQARIRELARQEKGEVTAIEASALNDGSAIVGFSSGSVLHCAANAGCEEFSGTPNVPVRQIAASREGASQLVWVAYRQGALYRCRDRSCEKLDR